MTVVLKKTVIWKLRQGEKQLYKLILADADDTLFDFEKAEKSAFERSLEERLEVDLAR